MRPRDHSVWWSLDGICAFQNVCMVSMHLKNMERSNVCFQQYCIFVNNKSSSLFCQTHRRQHVGLMHCCLDALLHRFVSCCAVCCYCGQAWLWAARRSQTRPCVARCRVVRTAARNGVDKCVTVHARRRRRPVLLGRCSPLLFRARSGVKRG